ncbi:MAG: hypothetical protein M1324_00320 [Patescibacteria group bacterium]|nr:hypothetical protein [Patescibacteria group bacterium]
MAEKGKGQMPVREAGRKGGETTSREHGPEFYHEIGKKGGETTSREHGPEFYHEIGTKGGHKVRELIRKAEETESKSGRKDQNQYEEEEE